MALAPGAATCVRAVSFATNAGGKVPSFKRRTKVEKRNRLRKKLIRNIKHTSGFSVNQKAQLAWLERFMQSECVRRNLPAEFVESVNRLIATLRQFGQSCEQATVAMSHLSQLPELSSNDP